MSRLPAMTYVDVIRRLRAAGFVLERHARSGHEIWYSVETRRRVPVPNHPGDVRKGTLRAIIREAGFTVDEFLKLGK